MSLIHTLLDNAYQDTEFLLKNDEKGDQFDKSRDVFFILYSNDLEKTASFCEFINDNQYGEAKYQQSDSENKISVKINMPSTQQLIVSISALMTCLAELFGVEYDGWDCEIQNPSKDF